MASGYDDTIAVRPDEGFDEASLADHLRGRLPGASGELQVRQFGGGKANLTYLLRFESAEYVLRRPPLGPVAPGSHDMLREHRVLSRLYQAFPLAPRSLLYCGDEQVIGAPFFVMERRRGVVVRRSMPARFAADAEAPRKLSRALIDALAQLHAVDYAALGLQDLGKPDGFLMRQVDGWGRRWGAARLEEVPDMESVHRWLLDNLPAESGSSLVHNDYKLDNMMFDENDPARPVAVFDWDMCTLGDPLSDLGALLAYWTQPDDPPHFKALAVMPPVGFPARAELIDRYARVSGRDLSHVAFFHALGLFRVAVIIAQIYFRFRRGQTQDTRFAGFGQLVPAVARAALEVTVNQ